MDPERRDLWNITLQNMAKNFPILGMFSFEKMKEQVMKSPERPYIVDVGGGRGQALLTIQEHCGDAFGGRLILQDLCTVIDTLRPDDLRGIEPMVYDIFTEQPVKSMCSAATIFCKTPLTKFAQTPTYTSCAGFSAISMTLKRLKYYKILSPPWLLIHDLLSAIC